MILIGKEQMIKELFYPDIAAMPSTDIEVKALKWFASLEPDEMLAQITYMYEDRMKRSQQEYEAVTG